MTDQVPAVGSACAPEERAERERVEAEPTGMGTSAVNRILEAALRSDTLEELGQECLRILKEITGSDYGFIGELGADGVLHDVAGGVGMTAPDGARMPTDLAVGGLYGNVVTSGQPYLTNEPALDVNSAKVPAGHPTVTSFVGVPLRRGESVVGVLALANRPGGYDQSHISLLEVVAPATESVLHRKRSSDEISRSSRLLAAHFLNSPLGVIEFDPDDRVVRWSESAERIFGYGAEEVLGKRIFDLHWVYEEDVPLVRAESEKLASGSVVRSESVNRNYRKDGSVIWCEWYSSAIAGGRGGTRSVLSLVLDVTARHEAEDALRDSKAHVDLLNEATSSLLSARDAEVAIRHVAEEVCRHLDCDLFFNYVLDEGRGRLSLNAWGGVEPETVARIEWLDPGQAVCGCVARDGAPINAEDVQNSTDERLDLVRSLGARAYVCVPVRIGDRTVGTLSFGSRRRDAFTPEEVGLVGLVAVQVSVAVERSRSERALRDAEERQAFLLELTDTLRTVRSAEEVQAVAARMLCGHLGGVRCQYGETDWTSGEPRYTVGAGWSAPGMPEVGREPNPRLVEMVASALQTGLPLVLEDARTAPGLDEDDRAAVVAMRAVASAIVPLMKDGRNVAWLTLHQDEPRNWTPQDISLIESVTERIWTAVARVRAEQEVLESKERFQSVLDSSVDAVYRRDLIADRYDYLGPAIERITGFTVAEFEALPTSAVFERIHPEDRERVAACLRKADETRRLCCEYRFLCKDGSYVWTADDGVVLFDEEGRPRFRSGIFRDISDRRRSEDEVRRHLAHEAGLKEIAEVASASLDSGELATRICETLARLFDAKQAQIRLVNEDRTRLAFGGAYDPDGCLRTVGDIGVDADTEIALVFRTGEPRIGEDVGASEPEACTENAALAGVRSYVLLPVVAGEETVGVLYLAWSDPRRFADADISFMKAAAAQMTAGLQNARLYEHQKVRRRRIEVLHGLLEVAVSSLDARSAAQAVLDYLERRQGYDLLSIWLASGDSLDLAAQVGYPESLRNISPIDLKSSYEAAEAFRSGKTKAVSHATNPATVEAYERMGIPLGSYAVLPLVSRGWPIGVLALVWKEPHPLGEHDIRFYESLAGEIAVVLENAMLFDAERERARLGDALAEIDRKIHSSLDFDDVASSALAAGTEAIGAGSAVIAMLSGDRWDARYQFGLDGVVPIPSLPRDAMPNAVKAIESGQSVIVEDVRADEIVNVPLVEEYGVRALAMAPLIVRGRGVGVLMCMQHTGPRRFSEPEVEFITRLASSLSLALDNARLYQEEHGIAQTLQETLVVVPVHVPGISFSRAYESATYQAGYVGGDFVDVFEVGRRTVALSIGDVSGKGIGAAVITSLVRNTMRAHAIDGLAPAQVCSKANTVMTRSTDVEAFVTLFFGLLDTSSGVLRYVSAGHPPALVQQNGRMIEKLDQNSPILGAYEHVTFHESRTTLRPGSRLVMYTDGVTEARSQHGPEFYEIEGLEGSLTENAYLRTVDLARALIDDVRRFSGGILRDDAALLVVEPTALRVAGGEPPGT